jgi:hypothetical protein
MFLILMAIVAMLSWGVFAVFWTFPNDQGATVNAVLNGENDYAANGYGGVIRPGSEGQYLMFYRTTVPAATGSGTYSVPGGQGFAFGPFLWTTPVSTISSYEIRYAIFTFEFTSQLGPSVRLWFSGPQGNLTASFYTNKYGGIFPPSPFTSYQTDVLQISGPGNYTMHYLNLGPGNLTGIVSMGPSSVVFTRPHLYIGATTIAVALALSTVTGFVLRKRARPSPTVPGPGGSNA